jgi:2-polyprenyl-3-methyl-5-hydroxy-6-metoxy-1,4-benzoquinol methylase
MSLSFFQFFAIAKHYTDSRHLMAERGASDGSTAPLDCHPFLSSNRIGQAGRTERKEAMTIAKQACEQCEPAGKEAGLLPLVENMHVLEVGFGSGALLQALQARGNEVYGIDAGKDIVEAVAGDHNPLSLYGEVLDEERLSAELPGRSIHPS